MKKVIVALIIIVGSNSIVVAQDTIAKYYTKEIGMPRWFGCGLQGCKSTFIECWYYHFYTKVQYDSIIKIQPTLKVLQLATINRKLLVDTCFDKYPTDTNKHRPILLNKPRDTTNFWVDGVVVRNVDVKQIADTIIKYYLPAKPNENIYAMATEGCKPIPSKPNPPEYFTQRQYDSIKKLDNNFNAIKIFDNKKRNHQNKKHNRKDGIIASKTKHNLDTIIKYYLPEKPKKYIYAMTTQGCKPIPSKPNPPEYFTQRQYDSIKKLNPVFKALLVKKFTNTIKKHQ